MRLIALAVMSIIALSAGWMLGKSVIGPSRDNQSQPDVSTRSAVDNKSAVDAGAHADNSRADNSDEKDKSIAQAAAASNLEARADEAQELQSASQDQNARQGADVYDDQGRLSRKATYSSPSQRTLVSANARKGPGIGVVAKPLKVVFKPLKKANPFRLRLW